MPKYRAPSPRGSLRKSNRATVARVRISMLIHIGRMNSITVILERLNDDLLSIQAAGYAISKQSSVLMNATWMEYRKVFRSCGVLKNLAKLSSVKAPVCASLNAYTAIIIRGRATNRIRKIRYGRAQVDLFIFISWPSV